ncbi:hypothetical protein P692DRAFT_20761328 [Suillus brevipes Sb2]|nr:hypothetical protein P692DRAFT_20761328 [Suillus brevipes Sb2]
MHFDYFTRYGEQGNGAPSGIHPDLLYKAGKSRVNHMQRIPYASSTIHANREQYSVLAEILQDICRLIGQAMEKYLPDVYSQLSFVCSLLPMGEHPVTAPFTGLALNIQCNTAGHLDGDDCLVCCVIPFGQYSNGQFVQYETGLVFDIVPGDFFIFPSGKITHFNLHFSGFRGSLVLHSDALTDSWVKDRNGWINHMNTTFDSSILL